MVMDNSLLNNVERDYQPSIMQIAIAEIQIYRYCCLFASYMHVKWYYLCKGRDGGEKEGRAERND